MRFSSTLAVLVGLAIPALSTPVFAQAQRAAAPGPTSGATATGTIAQNPDLQGPGIPGVDASQTTRATNNHEIFRVLGLSGQIAAPVTPSYNGAAAYTTFGGQPMKGGDAVLAQSIDGAP